jgi:hypothetical protein
MMLSDWIVGIDCGDIEDDRLPRVPRPNFDRPTCGAKIPTRWAYYRCTRRQAHGGRHCSTDPDGAVYAVWTTAEPTA